MTAARRRGMLLTRLAQYSFDISFTQTSFMARKRSGRLEGCFSATLFFITVHKFLIGLKLGLFPSQSKTFTFFFRKFVTNFDLWHGAPSCINILHLWTCMRAVERTFRRSWWFHLVKRTSHRSHVATLPPKSSGLGGVSWQIPYTCHHNACQEVYSRAFFSRRTVGRLTRPRIELLTIVE